MESLDYWRLCDELTVIEAALLIVGVDPSGEKGVSCETMAPELQPHGYAAAKTALCNAISSRKVRAMLRHAEQPRHSPGIDSADAPATSRGKQGVEIVEARGNRTYYLPPDWSKTTVAVDDLREWLRSRGVKTGFFFPPTADTPDYLDPQHPRYAPKLAAAVRAWLAVEDPKGKHPKQALEKWLREHAAEFELTNDDGRPNGQGIDECAKVANWQAKGGAPKTPGT